MLSFWERYLGEHFTDARRDAEEAAEEEAKARQTYEELRLRFGVKH